jgi:O-succinylbenzoic acid--CoA ligase
MNPQWMCNPRLEKPDQALLEMGNESRFEDHFFFSSSGSTGSPKWIALSAKALEVSALAVNSWLQVTQKDVFGLCLPVFHVGGYGMVERARVAGALLKNFESKWNTLIFHDWLLQSRVSVLSLVPTQVYDLVENNLQAPSSLRVVVVGGGSLTEKLYLKARELGWPLLISYGLTECASQVATAEVESLQEKVFPKAFLLPHISLKKIAEEQFALSSSCLLTGYFQKKEESYVWHDPKIEGNFVLPDRIQIKKIESKTQVQVLGRWEENFKILGELIDFGALKKLFYKEAFEQGLGKNLELGIFPHPRSENCVALICEKFGQVEKAFLKEFNQKVAPFERITHFYEGFVPRSELGKILLRKINPVCLQEYSG